jgi:preprotein translocase subunit YajC
MAFTSLLSDFHGTLLMSPPGGAGGQGGDPIMSFLPLILMAVIFYFLIFRPQKKRQKEREALVNAVQKGDKVITSSGIHGTVAQVEETSVLLQVSETTKIRIEKSSLGQVNPKSKGEA